MLRVAYVLPSLQDPSGWRRHALGFLGAIQTLVEPVLFVAAADAAAARQLFPGLPVFDLPATQAAALSTRRGVLSLIDTFAAVRRGAYPPVDLVHSLEAYPTGLVGSWLSRRLGCPHALTAHGTYGVIWAAGGRRGILDRRAYPRVLRQTRLVCPVSQGTADRMQQHFGAALRDACIHPVLNGNDFYRAVSREAALQRAWPEQPTLLTVGDLKPRKGQHASLAAFARLQATLPEARYFLAGRIRNQAYLEQLRQFVAGQGLREVHFLGAVSQAELDRLYRTASVFVLTPQEEGLHFEGFGLVYLEAGAYGLPVVAARSGGVADAVREGETGFLLEPDDVEGIATALQRLLAEPGLAQRMGAANRRWAETLTWEHCAAEQLLAYREALEAR